MSEPTVDYQADESASGGAWQERKALVAVAGVGGTLLVALAAWFLFFSGSPSEEDDVIVSGKDRLAAQGGATAKPSATTSPTAASTRPARADDLDLARDPFKELYPAKVVSSGSADSADDGADPGVPDGGPPVNGTDAPVDEPTVEVVPSSVNVKLVAIDVGNGMAKVSVDGATARWVGIDESLGTLPEVTLVSVDGEGRATFYVGEDPNDTVDIKVGKTEKLD